jgi:hypothetical protein
LFGFAAVVSHVKKNRHFHAVEQEQSYSFHYPASWGCVFFIYLYVSGLLFRTLLVTKTDGSFSITGFRFKRFSYALCPSRGNDFIMILDDKD